MCLCVLFAQKTMFMLEKYMIYIKLSVVAIVWGGTFIGTQTAGASFEPFFGGFLRFSIALVVLLPMTYFKEGIPKLPFKKWIELAALGFVGIFLYNFCFFVGLKHVAASRASLIVALNPIMVLTASIFFMGEKATFSKVAGILLSLVGAAIVISRGDLLHIAQQFNWGDFILLGCPISWGIYTLLGRSIFKGITPVTATTICVFCAWVMLGVASLFGSTNIENIPTNAWLSLLYLGIFGTVLGYIWYSEGMTTIGATRTAIFNNFVPVFAVMASVIFLKEEVPVSALVGGVLVISGVVLTNK
jgi:drug/metabolite transporter (DMT)-like permease